MREADKAEGFREKAFVGAAHAAFMWPREAAELSEEGRPLTELPGVGSSLARRIQDWIASPPVSVEPPPDRTEFLTLAHARRVLSERHDWVGQLKGDLQMHTEWSDGSGSISDMAGAAIHRGYHYIAITDHTKGLKIANGLDEGRLRKQGREIEVVNATLRKAGSEFTVLRSAEMNLNPLGEGDLDPACLAELDLVLGCFHSALRRKEDQTERYLAAIGNPGIHILGHPQTRVYGRREGLRADWHKVFALAARLDKAVEIDGYADRQDLRLSLLRIAREEGVRISLGTDAHHPEQLAFMELSLAGACLAEVQAERILNFMSVERLKTWGAKHRLKRRKRSY